MSFVRRTFLKRSLATSLTRVSSVLPAGLLTNSLSALGSSESNDQSVADAPTVLSDRPLALEYPPHLLDENYTSAGRLFVRNNGKLPALSDLDPKTWILTIDGEVERPTRFTIKELKSRFETVSLALQMECGGNGRRYVFPSASGNQWSFGAVACPRWTGVRLADLLSFVGLKPSATYTGHYGSDEHLSGDPSKVAISRGIPIAKAMEQHTLVAWAVNGEDLPVENGYPLRLVVPGWPGSCSQKWLQRIWLRDAVHDGAKMGGQSYRIPKNPVAPGSHVPDELMEIIQGMPVKSLITSPPTNHMVKTGERFSVRGKAWAGENSVKKLEISTNYGVRWTSAKLHSPINRFAWQLWEAELQFDQPGYFEIWARATDDKGNIQPPIPPQWNPRGYLNNMQHRVVVRVNA